MSPTFTHQPGQDACRWSVAGMQELNPLPGKTSLSARATNNKEQVVGT